jgi:hypothetical protein
MKSEMRLNNLKHVNIGVALCAVYNRFMTVHLKQLYSPYQLKNSRDNLQWHVN